MNFWASLEYAVGVMIGSCSVIGVVGAKYRNHYAQIVMVGISVPVLQQTMCNSGLCNEEIVKPVKYNDAEVIFFISIFF